MSKASKPSVVKPIMQFEVQFLITLFLWFCPKQTIFKIFLKLKTLSGNPRQR